MAQGGKENDVYWRIFDEFSNQSVDIIIDKGKFKEVLEKATSELLHSEMEKEKLPRLFEKNPVIGCKALMRCIRAFLRKGRYPDKDFEKILSILEKCDCGEIAGKMKARVDDVAYWLSGMTIKAEDNGFHKICDLSYFSDLEKKGEAQISETLNKLAKIEVSRTKGGSHTYQNFCALGRCIALSSCTWRCRFTLRSLKVQHVKKMFVSGLAENLKGNPCLEFIGFSLNAIGNEGLKALMDMPQSVQKTISELSLRGIAAEKDDFLASCFIERVARLEKLKCFDFQDNRFKEGEQELLIHVLCQLGNLQEVSLSSLSCDECSMLLESPPPQLNAIRLFGLSSDAVETALASCKTLQTVMIFESEITKPEVIKRSLKNSLPACSLKRLKLINCAIDSETACSIIEAAKTCQTLELLDLSNNVIRSTTDMCHLLQGSSFTDLNLYHNNFNESSIGEFLGLSSCQQQIPKIHLSMEWKEYAERRLPNIRHIVFEEMFEPNY